MATIPVKAAESVGAASIASKRSVASRRSVVSRRSVASRGSVASRASHFSEECSNELPVGSEKVTGVTRIATFVTMVVAVVAIAVSAVALVQAGSRKEQLEKVEAQLEEVEDLTSAEKLENVRADRRTPYPHNGYSYKLTNLTRSWYESQGYCQAIGGDLIVAGAKNYTLRRMISTYLELEDMDFVWIGLQDSLTEGGWKWIDGSPLDAATAEWAPGEPNSLGNEDCGTIVPNSQDGLNDISCTIHRLLAICEIPLAA